jgi:phosphatidylserine decarboxylase
MIRFGSRVDVFLPADYNPAVRIGEQVFAGQTVLACKARSEEA